MTTDAKDIVSINGRGVEYRNTNRLVGAKGWDIGLSKTGYTEEAGRCLIMRIKTAGKNATLVLLNAKSQLLARARRAEHPPLHQRRRVASDGEGVGAQANAAQACQVGRQQEAPPQVTVFRT